MRLFRRLPQRQLELDAAARSHPQLRRPRYRVPPGSASGADDQRTGLHVPTADDLANHPTVSSAREPFGQWQMRARAREIQHARVEGVRIALYYIFRLAPARSIGLYVRKNAQCARSATACNFNISEN
eukprot:7210605-Lingulodinium_polyedra.AAC.3